MANNHLITGVDIGSQNIRILAVERKNNENLDIVFQFQKEAQGMRRGVVIRPDEVADILRDGFEKMAEEAGSKPESVYINVGGGHIFASPSRGLISVSRADKKISEEDIQRVLQAAQDISIPRNNQIFDAVPREFIVDGAKGIKEAEGLEGVRLEVEVLILGGFTPYLGNLAQSVMDSDINEILNRIPSPIAASRACLTEKQKELGVALVDIGAGTTGLAVFEEGGLTHLSILPMGSSNITNDIAIGLKTDVEIAERIKIEYGSCLPVKSKKREKIELGEGENLVFSQKQLGGIINSRISEIFGEIYKDLKKISREKTLPSGIVLTGGGAKLPKIVDLARRELKLPVRIGCPQGIQNLRDPLWSVCCGLVLSGLDAEGEAEPTLAENFGSKIKKIFKSFIKSFIP